MNRLILIAVLLTLAGCGNTCFSDACWAQKNQAWIQQQNDYVASIKPTPPYVEFAKSDIGCIVYSYLT